MWTTRAPAKINVDLRITGRRPDGYHGLRTVFQTLALADALTLQPHDGPFLLTCTDPEVPTDAGNLAWRAAALVAQAVGTRLDGWHLHLDKRIPSQAGLGGGSSDAVAAARLCLAAWGTSWEDARLADLLAPIGADVAFFVTGGTMRGHGRGDDLERLPDLPVLHVVVVRPDFGVSTGAAYGWFDAMPAALAPAQDRPFTLPADGQAWAACWSACGNDLQRPVVARHPVIGTIVDALAEAGAVLALMSGSGSACFGVFESAESAAVAALAARRAWPPPWQVWETVTLPVAAYREATTPVHTDASC
jgi:4-diphosphocytidyl-2-C-methyl-D-erythritol kinase